MPEPDSAPMDPPPPTALEASGGETIAAMDTTIYWEGQLRTRIVGGNDPPRKDRHEEDAPSTAIRRVPGRDPISREPPSHGKEVSPFGIMILAKSRGLRQYEIGPVLEFDHNQCEGE